MGFVGCTLPDLVVCMISVWISFGGLDMTSVGCLTNGLYCMVALN